MRAPRSQQRIDEDVESLADVVACLDDVAAMAVDPGGKVRLDGVALSNDDRTMFEVTDPQRVARVSRPTTT